MNENEFKRSYAQIEKNIEASEELKRRTKETLGLAGKTVEKDNSSSARGTRLATRRSNNGMFAFSPAWRMAFAACLAVVAGVGLLFGTGAISRIGSTFVGNSFTLAAYAEEPSASSTTAAIGLEMFYPSRTSAGYLYDTTSRMIDPGIVTVIRYYVFDMTITGNNVESVMYSITGEGISYGSWKSDQESEGDVAEETSISFVVPYEDGKQVVREIGLKYVLNEEEKAAFDQLYEVRDANEMETLLATFDAKRLARATITATATFFDGATQAKSYEFEPVNGFENAYLAYLSRSTDAEDTETWQPQGEPSLFELVETNR